jgi:branched-chain amino acid transport system permease protein
VTQFFQLLIDGITLGSVYALIALGYSMIYGILKLLNFAQGDVYMVGAFIGYGVLQLFGGPLGFGIPLALLLVLMFAAAMAGAGAIGVVIERYAYRPLRNAPRVAPLVSSLGVAFFLENSALLLFGPQHRSYGAFEMNGGYLVFHGLHFGSVNISLVRLLVIASAILLMVLLILFVNKTQTGKAMQATSYDREAASMMGIDVDRVILVTFLIGSALAGGAGLMVGLVYSQVYHLMGLIAGLMGFTAAVVGGIGSIRGSVLGGVAIGLAQGFITGYVSSTFVTLLVFALLVAVMLVRPTGFFGVGLLKRV